MEDRHHSPSRTSPKRKSPPLKPKTPQKSLKTWGVVHRTLTGEDGNDKLDGGIDGVHNDLDGGNGGDKFRRELKYTDQDGLIKIDQPSFFGAGDSYYDN